jgi:hypothetical protein
MTVLIVTDHVMAVGTAGLLLIVELAIKMEYGGVKKRKGTMENAPKGADNTYSQY